MMFEKFEEIKNKNNRESNFSKVMEDREIDPELIEETREFYEEFVKPTVIDSYNKLLKNEK